MQIVQSREEMARAISLEPKGSFITPADFACRLGVGYCLEMQRHALPATLYIGCGSDASIAHDAIREGITHIYVALPPAMLEKIEAIASAHNVRLLADYPAAAIDIHSATA